MTRYNWDKQELQRIVSNCTSYAQVLNAIGLRPAGGNYATLKSRLIEFEIDTEHFTGQSWTAGKIFGPKRPIHEYLDNTYGISSNALRKRLISEEYLIAKCYSCSGTKWMGKDIPLELEHINGNHKDNSLENLTLLCPNCHAQTSTYRGRNIKPR